MKYLIDGKEIANNIRAERNRQSKTQKEIANKSGISLKTYIEYEKDASKIKAIVLYNIAVAIGCTVESFYLQNISTKREY